MARSSMSSSSRSSSRSRSSSASTGGPPARRRRRDDLPHQPPGSRADRHRARRRRRALRGARDPALAPGPAVAAVRDLGGGTPPGPPPMPPPPLTRPPQHAPGELHYWIANGIPGTSMPAWADVDPATGKPRLSVEDRWAIIRYLQALARGENP